MRAIAILLGLLLWLPLGCRKQKISISNLSGEHVFVIGHGGSGLPDIHNPYPFNSWEGVVYAVEHDNAEGIETDIQLSSDSVLVMYHDETLQSSSYCTGCVNDNTQATLTQCRLKPVSTGSGATYITPVEQVVGRFAARKIHPSVFLDIHTSPLCAETDRSLNVYLFQLLQAVNKLVGKYNAYDWISIQSNNRIWMRRAHKLYPQLHIYLDNTATADDVDFASETGLYGVAGPHSDMPGAVAELAHKSGLRVQLYGANAQGDIIDALGKSPDYFLTDNILLLQNILR